MRQFLCFNQSKPPRDTCQSVLRQDDVFIEPGAPFFDEDNPPQSFMRLAYSSISAQNIPEGVARIARAIDAMRP